MMHTIAAEERRSMEVYATELTSALTDLADPDLSIEHVGPRGRMRLVGGRPLGRLGGYIDRYVWYQLRATRVRADVNHILDHGYGHLALSLVPQRTVVTFHDAMLLRLRAHELPGLRFYPRLPMMAHRISLFAMRRVARVIADSESSRTDFLRFVDYDPRRVSVVPLGVSPVFRPQQEPRPPRSEYRILHVGHNSPTKNVEAVLRVLPAVAKNMDRPVTLVKVGAPFTAEQGALIDQLGIANSIERKHMLEPDDLPLVYQDADVVLLPSHHEGFGLPALEAMASGTPVVVSGAGALPEVVGDAALTIDPLDDEAIADAVCRVLTDPALAKDLRKRGLERARSFTWARTAQQTLSVYREVHAEASRS